MMVDSLDGQLHQAYGTLPNMSWIISTQGELVYKADWTDPRAVGEAIDQFLFEQSGHRVDRSRLDTPTRNSSLDDFMQGLLDVPGPRAAREFVEAIEARSGVGAGDPMRAWLATHRHPID